MIPLHAPLNALQQAALNELLPTLSPEQKAWLGGYFSALTGAVAAPPVTKVTVLYGTESGTSEALAEKTAKRAKSQGAKVKLVNMADAKLAELKGVENLLVIVSTWGDGEPPEAAEFFYNALMNESVDLSKVNFSVCALGDTSYDKFCQTGKDVDARLETLGAKRIVDRQDCDVDFEDSYAVWVDRALETLGASAASAVVDIPIISSVEYNKKNPFPAEVLENLVLNGEGSAKETVHLELDLNGSGLDYEAGDALAVVPLNCEQEVADILTATKIAPDTLVEVKGVGAVTFEEALSKHLDITALSKSILKKYNALANSEEIAAHLADGAKEQLKDWLWGRQIIDLLQQYPVTDLTAEQLVGVLRKLPPRLYSIASSPKAHPGEVHLTVAAVRYESYGRQRKGVASTYLADKATLGEKVEVYVHKNKNFRLPESTDTPVIMVGPGTGIAPFRAFIEERGETAAKGGTWLFFGDQHYTFDFLYQLELQDHLKSGALDKLDVAFSRDQPEKVYVQDKMIERGAELYAWLEKGAHFYVCGDASRMAADVHNALLEVVAQYGGMSQEEAAAYVDILKKDKRYQRDVY